NTGWVVVGGIGDHLRTDYTAVGDTTNLAARLQQIAEPGSVLISESTWRLVHGEVQAEPLAPTQVKGKSEPVQVYRLLGLGATQADQAGPAVRGGGGLLAQLVGGEREITVLDELGEQSPKCHGHDEHMKGNAGS